MSLAQRLDVLGVQFVELAAHLADLVGPAGELTRGMEIAQAASVAARLHLLRQRAKAFGAMLGAAQRAVEEPLAMLMLESDVLDLKVAGCVVAIDSREYWAGPGKASPEYVKFRAWLVRRHPQVLVPNMRSLAAVCRELKERGKNPPRYLKPHSELCLKVRRLPKARRP